MHFRKLLTVRSVIENYEKSFGHKLQKKNISRLEKWKEYLTTHDEKFKPFKALGYTIEQISSHVEDIFNQHSANIHSVMDVNGKLVVLKVQGILSDEQVILVNVMIQHSPWKNLVRIEN